MVCFLSLIQTASAMSFHVSALSVYALNANGLVNPGQIAHINSVINALSINLSHEVTCINPGLVSAWPLESDHK